MADGQVGGNESVHWVVNADDASDVEDVPAGMTRPRWQQCGIDYHRNPEVGKDFTVRVKIPVPRAKRAAFLRQLAARVAAAALNPNVEILEFRLPIETGPVAHTQVQVSWGKKTNWYEGLRDVHPAQKPKAAKGNGAASAGATKSRKAVARAVRGRA